MFYGFWMLGIGWWNMKGKWKVERRWKMEDASEAPYKLGSGITGIR